MKNLIKALQIFSSANSNLSCVIPKDNELEIDIAHCDLDGVQIDELISLGWQYDEEKQKFHLYLNEE